MVRETGLIEAHRSCIELAHSDTSHQIIGEFYRVYNTLGSGLTESVYQRALVIALGMRGLRLAREVPMTVMFERQVVGEYRADLVVENVILVETKAVERLVRQHDAQVLNYLRISRLRVGLLFNFGPTAQFRRLISPVSAPTPEANSEQSV
ncbi:MAG TPA: GxxExxY protein [Gemmatimonas sp.]|nr:GxxExxY protein [Gemmatimonas sp.]